MFATELTAEIQIISLFFFVSISFRMKLDTTILTNQLRTFIWYGRMMRVRQNWSDIIYLCVLYAFMCLILFVQAENKIEHIFLFLNLLQCVVSTFAFSFSTEAKKMNVNRFGSNTNSFYKKSHICIIWFTTNTPNLFLGAIQCWLNVFIRITLTVYRWEQEHLSYDPISPSSFVN